MTIQLLPLKQIMLEMDTMITPKAKSYLLCYAVRYEVSVEIWGHEQIKLYDV